MFSFWDHLTGAVTVRIHRFFLSSKKQPDAVKISPNLFCGGQSSLSSLQKIGINSVVDLTENQDNKHFSTSFSMNYFGLPIPDRDIPSIELALETVQWIDSQLKNKQRVFIHCNLGRGRGPLLTILYLIYSGMKKNDAIELLIENRPYVFLNPKQQKFIDKFEEQLS